MRYQIIPVTPFEQNCTLLWCEASQKAAVIDPGGDLERVLKAVDQQGVALEKILVTHGHIDHAGAVGRLSREHHLPIEGPHESDRYWIEGMPKQSEMFGFPAAEIFEPDRWLQQGDRVTLGEETLEVLHCPGHTPGHVVFYHPGDQLAIVGDVLFKGSIGRTDFPGGSHHDLIRSIKERLFPLGDEVQFIPGHGPTSTIGYEREHNPFLY